MNLGSMFDMYIIIPDKDATNNTMHLSSHLLEVC
jgi:hypothetical protein